MNRWSKRILLSIFGVIALLVLNYGVIEDIVIPNPCYYHNHDTTFLFDLFYSLPGFEGFHPFPTKFNFLLTVSLGIALGLVLERITRKQRNSNLIDK